MLLLDSYNTGVASQVTGILTAAAAVHRTYYSVVVLLLMLL